jgi:predicted amidohydrolase
VLLRARAIETGCFPVAAAQCGAHADGRHTFGHSLVVNPWGEILCDMGTEPGTAMVTIDPAEVGDARRRIPNLAAARPLPPAEVAP